MEESRLSFRLLKRQGGVFLRVYGTLGNVPVTSPGKAEYPVLLAQCAPGWGPERGFAVLEPSRGELFRVKDPCELDAESRRVAFFEMGRRYGPASIVRVLAVRAFGGHSRWEVLTDAGRRSFRMSQNGEDMATEDGGGMLLRDSLGHLFRLPSWGSLDEKSRSEARKALVPHGARLP